MSSLKRPSAFGDEERKAPPQPRAEDSDQEENEEEDDEEEDFDWSQVHLDASAAAAEYRPTFANPRPPNPFVLEPFQEPVVAALELACQRHRRAINCSRAGLGKTVMQVELTRRLGMPQLTLGPAAATGLDTMWEKHLTKHGVSYYPYISWEKLRGSRPANRPRPPKNVPEEIPLGHPYLRRYDVWCGKYRTISDGVKRDKDRNRIDPTTTGEQKSVPIYQTRFVATPAWKNLVQAGVVLVTDEVQRAKNDSLQNKAIACLVQALVQSPRSCVVALSATTMDEYHQAVPICNALSLMDGPAYRYDKSQKVWEKQATMHEFETFWATLDPEKTRSIKRQIHANDLYFRVDSSGFLSPAGRVIKYSKKTGSKENVYVFMLYSMVVQRAIGAAASMKFNSDPRASVDYRGVVYRMQDATKSARYVELARQFAEAQAARESVRAQDDRSPPLDLTAIAREMEVLKGERMVSEALKRLHRVNPHTGQRQHKVLLFFNYTDPLASAIKTITAAGFTVGVIDGMTPKKERERCMAEFQEPSSRLRCIVGNLTAMSTGLSFHSTSPDWPRASFLSPTTMATPMAQAMMRTYRVGVRGHVEVVIAYGGGEGEDDEKEDAGKKRKDEAATLQRLFTRTQVLKATGEQQVMDGVPFPGTLPLYREVSADVFVLDVPKPAEAAAEPLAPLRPLPAAASAPRPVVAPPPVVPVPAPRPVVPAPVSTLGAVMRQLMAPPAPRPASAPRPPAPAPAPRGYPASSSMAQAYAPLSIAPLPRHIQSIRADSILSSMHRRTFIYDTRTYTSVEDAMGKYIEGNRLKYPGDLAKQRKENLDVHTDLLVEKFLLAPETVKAEQDRTLLRTGNAMLVMDGGWYPKETAEFLTKRRARLLKGQAR